MAKKDKKKNSLWIIKITLLTFMLSIGFSFVSEITIPNISLSGGVVILIVFILLGVIFDMIGVAITSCDEEPFHAKSSRKVKGASTAVKLLKNADKVSSICNDVVGDICGILSGSVGVMIISTIISKFNTDNMITTLVITALIASFTIGGKAIGKGVAIKNNEKIVFSFSKILSIFYK